MIGLPPTAAQLRSRVSANAALTTPFGSSGEIDWKRLTDHATDLLSRGLSSITLFGTTGEGVSVSLSEHETARSAFDDAGIRSDQIVECVFQTAVDDAAEQCKRALANGCAALLVTPPYYFRPVDETALFRWYASLFDQMGAHARDVILYNIPGMTGVTITPKLVSELRRAFPDIIAGIKDSSGDFDATRRLLGEHGDLVVLVGHEGQLADAIALGASGSISGIANFAPEFIMRLVSGQADDKAGKLVAAIVELPVIPAIRAIVSHCKDDPIWLQPRPPLTALSSEQIVSLIEVYDDIFALTET